MLLKHKTCCTRLTFNSNLTVMGVLNVFALIPLQIKNKTNLFSNIRYRDLIYLQDWSDCFVLYLLNGAHWPPSFLNNNINGRPPRNNGHNSKFVWAPISRSRTTGATTIVVRSTTLSKLILLHVVSSEVSTHL